MQNRFGLKDFVMLVLLLAVGVSIWLGMYQEDRRWEKINQVETKIGDLEKQLARVDSKLERGVPIAGPPAKPGSGPSSAPNAPPPASTPQPGAHDESWARPSVPIEWQPKWGLITDPRQRADFKPGGEFPEIFEGQPKKLVPFVQTDVYGRRIVDLVAESLGTYDPATLKLRGWLAEAWQYDPSGLWLRVKINDRARFSDGQPVTAEDVRWTFHDFVFNKQIDAERSRSILDTITKVEVISDKVVEFTFKEAFFSNLDSALTLFVLPKHFYEKFTPAQINKSTGLLMGSGPFKFAQLDPENQWSPPAAVVLVRNEQYWGELPSLATIRFKAINDEQPRLVAYKNGEADMITPSAPQYASLAADAEFPKSNQMLNWMNMRSGNSFIAWNCGKRNGKPTPFVDARVRRAMTHLLDREKMIRDIWKGLGVVSKGYFNPTSPASPPDVKAWPYDLDKAKALLKEAGWEDRDGKGVLTDKDGNEFVFEFTYFSGGEIAERIANFVKDASAAAGIRCTLRPMDWSVGEETRKSRDFDAMTLSWGANAPESDPKQIFHSSSIDNQGDNFAQWSNADADKMIDAGRRELDYAKRIKCWNELDRIIHQDQPYTWVRIQPYLRVIKPDVGNVNKYPKGLELWEFYRGGPAAPSVGN